MTSFCLIECILGLEFTFVAKDPPADPPPYESTATAEDFGYLTESEVD